MAEIRIEQKKRSMAWLWILLLVIIAAAVAWYVTRNSPAPSAATASPVGTVRAPSVTPMPAPRVDEAILPMTSGANRMRLVNA